MVAEAPRLSPSIGIKLIEESPRAAWASHRLLGNHRKPTTDSQREGRLWHSVLLENGKGVVVIDADSFRTKAAKEERDKALFEGNIPVIGPKWEVIQAAVPRIQEELKAVGVQFTGVSEEKFLWEEVADDGTTVFCSGVIDHYSEATIFDVKTEPVVNQRLAALSIARSHAILQDASYKSAFVNTYGGERERLTMIYVFIQTEEPFVCVPVVMSGEYQEVSFLKWRRAINAWALHSKGGTDKKHWPGPVQSPTRIEPPGWMMPAELELEGR